MFSAQYFTFLSLYKTVKIKINHLKRQLNKYKENQINIKEIL